MIGLDTSVLARYLLRDEPRQSARATAFIRSTVERGELLFVSAVVLCELVWVLESGYGYAKDAIVDVLEQILATDQIVIEGPDEMRAALGSYRVGKGDFSDYVIGGSGRAYGCDRTITFDRGLRKEPDFEVLA